MRILLLSLALAGLAGAAWGADQVTMKNGDRLSGTVTKSDTKGLVIKTEFAGEVTISWDAITAITSSSQLHVNLKDGQTLVGTVTTPQEGRLAVATKETGTVTTTKDAVTAIRSDAEQQTYDAEVERLRNPRLIDLWTGTLDLGYANTHGNANTSTFSLSGNAARATTRDKISVYYTSVFSSSNASGTQLTTANAKRGGIAYNLNVSKEWFVFGSVDLESDQFQSLDLRFVPAGGGGYHAIANLDTTLDFNLGASADREFFNTGLNRTSAALVAGEELNQKLNKITTLHEKLMFYPDVSSPGDYRVNFDLSAVTTLRKWLSWQLTASDRFLSNPLAGRKTNDILFTTGFRLTFAK